MPKVKHSPKTDISNIVKTSKDSNKNEEINAFHVVKAPSVEESVMIRNKNPTKSLELRHLPNLDKQGKIKTLFFV